MEKHPIIRPVGLAISIYGIIDSFGWFIASLVGTCFSLFKFEPELTADTYIKQINLAIYSIYFADNTTTKSIFILRKEFLAIMSIQTILSCVRFVISIVLFLSLRKNQSTKKSLKNKLISWVVVTITICLEDLIVTIILGLDYQEIVTQYNKNTIITINEALILSITAVGIVMTIAAKGFIIWVLNLASSIIFILFIGKLGKVKKEEMRDFIHGFQQPEGIYSPPSFMEVTNGEEPHLRRVSTLYGSSDFERRSRSYSASTRGRTNENYDSNHNLATIGRSKKTSPTLNKVKPPTVPSPPIPNPDYTPPSSPSLKPKSVLKSNHQYY